MANLGTIKKELISVIIPCYNHGRYLRTAIESVLAQTYPNVEIIVVDDGSKDNTKEVAAGFDKVKYVYQQNSGLSASRNTGIKESKGEYLLFLDADDWLYPEALQINYDALQQNPKAAFVSGAYEMKFVESNEVKEIVREVKMEPYEALLHNNYVGMIATVLFRRFVFDEFQYDVNLKRCEDYDLYFKITRKYPVVHHQQKIAVYCIHQANMSSNEADMLDTVLEVLKRQKKLLKSANEMKAFEKGKEIWKNYYCGELLNKLKKGIVKPNFKNQVTLLKYKPKQLISYWVSAKS